MPSIDYCEVKARCPTLQYLRAMGWEPTSRPASRWWRGWCPLHSGPHSTGDTFHAHPDGWHCHKCRVGGSVIDLAARLKGLTIFAAAFDVCQTLGVAVPYLPNRTRRRRRRNMDEAP